MFGIKNKYYCLIASLREYAPDFAASGAPLPHEIREEISSELSPADLKSLELLYLFYDLENIIGSVKGKNALFNPLGNLSKDEIEKEIENAHLQKNEDNPFRSRLPKEVGAVMDNFLREESYDIEEFHKELLKLYYSLAGQSDSRFLKLWSEADRTMRNIIAVTAARSQGIDPAETVIGDGEAEQSMVSSRNNDYGIAAENEWFGELIAILQVEDFIEREKKLDTLKWNIADAICEHEYFSMDFLLGYMTHLNILARWSTMDRESGDRRFREIVASFTEGLDLE